MFWSHPRILVAITVMAIRLLLLALLAIISPRLFFAQSFEGVYSGTFSGVSVGKFVAAVQADNTINIWGYDQTWETGLRNTLQVAADGTFSGIVGVTLVSGSVNAERVSGSGSNSDGAISFSGNRKPDTGPVNHFVGCYAGPGSSNIKGSIQVEAIVAADGTAWFYSMGMDLQNGGEGNLNPDGSFSVTDVVGITYIGSISETDFSISGSFSGGGETGQFSLVRKTNFLPPLKENLATTRVLSSVASNLQVQINTQDRRSYSIYRTVDLSTWVLVSTLRGDGLAQSYFDTVENETFFYRVDAK